MSVCLSGLENMKTTGFNLGTLTLFKKFGSLVKLLGITRAYSRICPTCRKWFIPLSFEKVKVYLPESVSDLCLCRMKIIKDFKRIVSNHRKLAPAL